MSTELPADAKEMDRAAFDDLARAEEFAAGPWVSSFGDGYGQPYCPPSERKVWGRLKDGRAVWAGPVK